MQPLFEMQLLLAVVLPHDFRPSQPFTGMLSLFQKAPRCLIWVYCAPVAETYILAKSGGLLQSALRLPYLEGHENISPSSSGFEVSPARFGLSGEILKMSWCCVRVQARLSATFYVGLFAFAARRTRSRRMAGK